MQSVLDMKLAHHTAIALAAALLSAGCSKEYIDEEALSFGYKPEDAKSTNLVFLSASPAVTNWVPERVVNVYSSYEWTKDELALIAAAQAVEPSGEIEKIPDGFAKDLSGAWLTFWEKKAECFGESGIAGFIAHFNEDKKVWETGESYFSCYWATREEALAALSRIEAKVAAGFSPKKFHRLAGGWVAEYVRLCATCIVGQKADGRWSCMFDLRDKCRPGCGTWYPEDEQQTHYDMYKYSKALKAWREQTAKVLKANHEALAKEMESAGLTGFTGEVRQGEAPDGRLMAVLESSGRCEDAQTLWDERAADAKKMFGGEAAGAPETDKSPDGGEWRGGNWNGAFHDVRIDIAVAPAKEGETGREARWRIIAVERLLPGRALPRPPERATAPAGK